MENPDNITGVPNDDLDAEVVPVDQLDATPPASFVDEVRQRKRRSIIPPWLRSWVDIRAAVRHITVYYTHVVTFHVARIPLYAATLTMRCPVGLWRSVRALVRWLFDLEGHIARVAMASTQRRDDVDEYVKLARIRDKRVRWRGIITTVTLAVAVPLAAAGIATAPWWALVLAGAVIVGILGAVGTPADRPVIGRAVVDGRLQRLTSDVVIRALSVLGIAGITQALAKNPDTIRFPAPITRDGPGYRADVDLPPGVTVAEVMDRRAKLASGLGRPLGCVWPEGASDIHPGRLVLWVGDQDMATSKKPPWPLATTGTTDLFTPVPVGTDQRGQWVSITLMFVSAVIGAIPRMGKTFALRLFMLIAALDPRAEVHGYDLKGTGDLSPLEAVAHRYRAGDTHDDIVYGLDTMRAVRVELRRRAQVIRGLPRDLCPENQVTPQLASNRTLGLHPIIIGVDECQLWFDNPDHGAELADICEDLVRRGPAVGIVIILATQRPDAKSLPTGISANAVLRFCLKVMGQVENDMVLGTSAYRNGIRATTLSFRDKGIGYLRGDGEETRIVHTTYIDGPAADNITHRARSTRQAQNRLTGYAAGADHNDTTTTTRRDTLLDDIAAVIPRDVQKMWSETIVDRLAELRPTVYGEWAQLTGAAKASQLAAALKPYGITTGQVWGTDPATGAGANRRGIVRADITRALAQRDRQPPSGGGES